MKRRFPTTWPTTGEYCQESTSGFLPRQSVVLCQDCAWTPPVLPLLVTALFLSGVALVHQHPLHAANTGMVRALGAVRGACNWARPDEHHSGEHPSPTHHAPQTMRLKMPGRTQLYCGAHGSVMQAAQWRLATKVAARGVAQPAGRTRQDQRPRHPHCTPLSLPWASPPAECFRPWSAHRP